MKDLVIYQLEVASCLAVFYLFYQLLLKKETHFTMRRYYFLSAGILAFIIPAMHFSIDLAPDDTSLPSDYLQYLPQQFMEFTPIYSPVQSSLDVWSIVGYIWIFGFVLMCIRIVVSLARVQLILNKSVKDNVSDSFKISTSKSQSFTFFKTIVLSQNHYKSHAFAYILAHEQAHSDQYHSVDVLFIEMIKALQWFNPFVWMYSKEALQNLEYLADQSVIKKQYNSMEYQKAIVQFALPSNINNLRSEFSKSNLKNRITMMYQPKIRKSSKAKILLLVIMMLPFIAAMLMSFSIKVTNNGNQSYRSETEITTSSRTINGTVIKQENGEAISGAIITIVGSANKGSVTDQEGNFTISVEYGKNELLVSFVNMASQVVDIRNKDEVVVKLTSADAESVTKVEDVVSFSYKYLESEGEKEPLIVVDGIEKESKEKLEIDPSSIETISVIKDMAAVKIYGEKAKHGVIIIKTK